MADVLYTVSTIPAMTEETTDLVNESLRTETDQMFYGLEFESFYNFYRPIHGYLSLAVCVFGIIANVLNIIVLTRY